MTRRPPFLRRSHPGDTRPGPGGAQDVRPFGPGSVEVAARRLRIGDGYAATFIVAGWPREVGPGWLEPLLTYPARLDVAVHLDPLPAAAAADRLRRQLARLESGRRAALEHGRLADPDADLAADDARDLANRLARGQDRLLRVALVLTVHAADPAGLAEDCDRVRALAAGLLLSTAPATFRQLQGWTSTLPVGLERLSVGRTFDSTAAAAAFPFTSPDLPLPTGSGGVPVLIGANTASAGLVVHDRFDPAGSDNHNMVILARSGAGKSYLAKLDVLRHLYAGVHVAVVDPEDEYARLADLVGGTRLHLGAPGVRLNPFDLPAAARTHPASDPEALTRRILFLHTLIAVLVGPVDPAARTVLDRALLTTYRRAGISADPTSWTRPAPLLADLTTALADDTDPAGPALAGRLTPYTTGSHRGLFDGPTTTRPAGHLTVYGLRGLPEELAPAATLLALDTIWRQVADPTDRRRRMVVVDEAWLLMADPAGARFLFRLAKAARKHWAGLTVITQDAADLLGTDLGNAVVSNAATQILLRQAPQAVDTVAAAFNLSAGERTFLLAARQGDGLLLTGAHRVGFHALASPREHHAATSNPAELTRQPAGPPTSPAGDSTAPIPPVAPPVGDDTDPC